MSEVATELSRGPGAGSDRPSADERPRPAEGFRDSFGTALAVVLADPQLWLLGALGFLVRGGWLLLALPIWVLPSPVAISTLLGPDAIGPAGPAPRTVTLALAAAAVTCVLLLCGVIGGALVDLASFERFARDPETIALRRGRAPRGVRLVAQLRTALDLAGLQGTMLLPAVVAVILSIQAVIAAAAGEFLLPGSLEVPLVVRIAVAVQGPLLLVAALLFLGDLLGDVIARPLLARRFGVPPREPRHGAGALRFGLRRLRHRPLDAFLAAVVAWLVTLALVVPAMAAVLIAWGGVRAVFLAQRQELQPGHVIGWAAVTIVFVALWCAALLLAGLASAIRSALWSAEALR